MLDLMSCVCGTVLFVVGWLGTWFRVTIPGTGTWYHRNKVHTGSKGWFLPPFRVLSSFSPLFAS